MDEKKDLGTQSAEGFIKNIIEHGDITWLASTFPNADKKKLSMEFVAFEIFLIVVSLNAFYEDKKYKGPDIGLAITKKFIKRCGELLEELKLYDNYREFMEPRMIDYDKALHNNKEPNYIYWTGKEFCLKVGQLSIGGITGISTYMVKMMIANKKLIEGFNQHYGYVKKQSF